MRILKLNFWSEFSRKSNSREQNEFQTSLYRQLEVWVDFNWTLSKEKATRCTMTKDWHPTSIHPMDNILPHWIRMSISYIFKTFKLMIQSIKTIKPRFNVIWINFIFHKRIIGPKIGIPRRMNGIGKWKSIQNRPNAII